MGWVCVPVFYVADDAPREQSHYYGQPAFLLSPTGAPKTDGSQWPTNRWSRLFQKTLPSDHDQKAPRCDLGINPTQTTQSASKSTNGIPVIGESPSSVDRPPQSDFPDYLAHPHLLPDRPTVSFKTQRGTSPQFKPRPHGDTRSNESRRSLPKRKPRAAPLASVCLIACLLRVPNIVSQVGLLLYCPSR